MTWQEDLEAVGWGEADAEQPLVKQPQPRPMRMHGIIGEVLP